MRRVLGTEAYVRQPGASLRCTTTLPTSRGVDKKPARNDKGLQLEAFEIKHLRGLKLVGSARFELATYGLRDAAPGLGMGLDLIPLSIKSSTYENSTELDRKCPKPAASSIAINCAIKWRPSDPTILSPAKAVSGTQIGRCRASGTRKNCGHRPCWHPYGRLAPLLYLGTSVRGRGVS